MMLILLFLCISARCVVQGVKNFMWARKLRAEGKLGDVEEVDFEDVLSWAGKGPSTCPDKFRGLYWLDGNAKGSKEGLELVDYTYSTWDSATNVMQMDLLANGLWIMPVMAKQWDDKSQAMKDIKPEQSHNAMTAVKCFAAAGLPVYNMQWDESATKGDLQQNVFFVNPRCWYHMDFIDVHGDGRIIRRRSYYPVLYNCAGAELAARRGRRVCGRCAC